VSPQIDLWKKEKLYHVRLYNPNKFVVGTLVLFTDKARTEVLTTKKFYYGQLSEHDIIPYGNSRIGQNHECVECLEVHNQAFLEEILTGR
jgi:hypothetical protein